VCCAANVWYLRSCEYARQGSNLQPSVPKTDALSS
jgi:hypothetical protein